MPTSYQNVTTTAVVIASENPRRVVLAIKNTTELCSGTNADYIRVSDDKANVETTKQSYLLAPGDSIVLQKCDGDHPEKTWYAATESGTGCVSALESMEDV